MDLNKIIGRATSEREKKNRIWRLISAAAVRSYNWKRFSLASRVTLSQSVMMIHRLFRGRRTWRRSSHRFRRDLLRADENGVRLKKRRLHRSQGEGKNIKQRRKKYKTANECAAHGAFCVGNNNSTVTTRRK